jgi:hypothetical protein
MQKLAALRKSGNLASFRAFAAKFTNDCPWYNREHQMANAIVPAGFES